MNAERTPGLVLRVRPLTETSLIVHWLTEHHGRLATVAKGARRPKSPFRGKLDLFYEADLSFQRSRRSDLHTLREVVVRDLHPVLRTDLARLRAAAYVTQLLERTTEPEAPVPELYALLREFLRAVAAPLVPLTLAFELKLLAALGLQPDLARSRLSPTAQTTARTLAAAPLAAVGSAQWEPGPTRELGRLLRDCLINELGRLPHGRFGVTGTPEEFEERAPNSTPQP
jgi:DNA repair protein RecO (recombination protein O)